MKRRKKEPTEVVRVNIKRQGDPVQNLTLIECSFKEAFDKLKSIISSQKISAVTDGRATSVNLREGKGVRNGKSRSFAVRGLSPEQVLKLFEKEIPEQ